MKFYDTDFKLELLTTTAIFGMEQPEPTVQKLKGYLEGVWALSRCPLPSGMCPLSWLASALNRLSIRFFLSIHAIFLGRIFGVTVLSKTEGGGGGQIHAMNMKMHTAACETPK